jgi:hypothetical protein
VTLEQNHIDEGGSEVLDGEYDDDMGGVSENPRSRRLFKLEERQH